LCGEKLRRQQLFTMKGLSVFLNSVKSTCGAVV
jgi:hypothetical protein